MKKKKKHMIQEYKGIKEPDPHFCSVPLHSTPPHTRPILDSQSTENGTRHPHNPPHFHQNTAKQPINPRPIRGNSDLCRWRKTS